MRTIADITGIIIEIVDIVAASFVVSVGKLEYNTTPNIAPI